MASIKQRKNNVYDVTVSYGYDINGKKKRYYKTITLDEKLTEKQRVKELNKLVTKFEDDVHSGRYLDGHNLYLCNEYYRLCR